MIGAWNAADEAAVRSEYAEDAIFVTIGPTGEIEESIQGADEIAAWAARFGSEDPWGIERVTEVVASGDLAMFGGSYNCTGSCAVASTLTFDDEGKIWRHWVVTD
jgi:ketosteroid isomerase-like protein